MVEIRTDYDNWIEERQEKARQEGKRYLAEVDFGVNWKIHGELWETWRVSWIEDTGELYAYGLDANSNDIFIVHPRRFKTEEEVREHLRQQYEDLYDNHCLESVFPLPPPDKSL